MIRSMTGYGEASAHVGGAHFVLEVRSLNNKYLKAVLRLPEELQSLEAELETRLREKISRGTVTVNASVSNQSESAAYEINRKALNRYIEQLKGIDGSPAIDLGALLALPGVLQPPADAEGRFEATKAAMLDLLEKAIKQLQAMREREGKNLVADLRTHHQVIAAKLKLVSDRAPEVIADYERRLRTRIDALLKDVGVKIDSVDLVREIAAYAERTDIAEEINRLSAHLEQFEELISSNEPRPLGRTLDFLAQEMLREANTIASKSPDATISRHAVEIKGAIDRIKEQAQNVE
ncbi:MAG: YicC family protein [Phycisphaerales bacterium]|mgnify:CR=1 FL=1|nr:YicC family protein [Phycisphaerales bacterium]